MRYVALLRGINVGGSGKLPMPRLREIAAECGLANPRTYIQSGNLVADSDLPAGCVAALLEDALLAELGAPCPVVVLSAEELARVRAANPFADRGAEPRQLHVVFALPTSRPAPRGPLPDPADFAPEEYVIDGPVTYLYLPDGIGRSRLAAALTRPSLPQGTARNWRTVEALVAMSAPA